MRSVNPATGEVIGEYEDHGPEEVAARLTAAERGFRSWKGRTFAERASVVARAAQLLREGREGYARLMTREMGKTLASAEAEVDKCAWACEFYAEHAERFLAPEAVATDASKSFVRFDPLGPVLAIMPWNFPFWQVFRFAAPALMAGNTGLLKHAPNVSGCALAIEEVLLQAGSPPGVFSALLVEEGTVGTILAHPAVRAVTLTGSGAAGASVAARAGAELKKSVLELGGSDPFIVLADADPASSAREAARARCVNNGQSCIAAKRFIVEDPLAERFEEALAAEISALRVGDPADRATDVGPMAREDLLEKLADQVGRSVAAGARVLAGGTRLRRPGYYYAPTVLAGVEPGMAAFDEETFGPVAAVTRARDEAHALALANASSFGLGASVWTGDPAHGEALAREIEAGCVFVNGAVKSDPRLPFGGIKGSGFGRELSAYGIREFVNVKSVWVA